MGRSNDHGVLARMDQSKKTMRHFYCRDVLWETFEQMANDFDCSIDYLINEAMRYYARSKNYQSVAASPAPQPISNPSLGAMSGSNGPTARVGGGGVSRSAPASRGAPVSQPPPVSANSMPRRTQAPTPGYAAPPPSARGPAQRPPPFAAPMAGAV